MWLLVCELAEKESEKMEVENREKTRMRNAARIKMLGHIHNHSHIKYAFIRIWIQCTM